MTDAVDIVNRALASFGARTTITAAQLVAQTTNEAKQAMLVMDAYRDQLLRMAPWDCAIKTANMTYITSVPGTPENTSPATNLWQPGQPPPPWAYEYQYPVDCLRACWIIPAIQTGFAGGVPITTAVTGGATTTWLGPPIRFKVQTDEFYPVISAAVVSGGTGAAVGDIITLEQAPQGTAPLGAPVQLQVTAAPAGIITTVDVVNQIKGSSTPKGGSYFAKQTTTQAQASTTGSGIGATFNLTFGPKGSQRVILTNQELATLAYVKQVTDPNVTDDLFQEAWVYVLGAALCRSLTGDLKRGNNCIEWANQKIAEARKADANEGLTVNDVTPDWIRVRGFAPVDGEIVGPFNQGFDWGAYWPMF